MDKVRFKTAGVTWTKVMEPISKSQRQGLNPGFLIPKSVFYFPNLYE